MSSFTPTVSIVICVYNGADTIAESVNSLIKQDYPGDAYEIIVVNNCSTDNTVEIVEKFPVRLFQCETRGPAPARNFGINKSVAEIIAFTDADCIAAQSWLSELIKPYADPRIGGVGGAIQAYQHPDRSIVEIFSDEHSPLVNYISGKNEFLPHLYTANASYRRELILQIGGFNEKLVTAQDVDFAWQLQLQLKTKLFFTPNAIIYHYHRTTRAGLARQYRRYGFGEILLDTLYGKYPDYPRNRNIQLKRLFQHFVALPRYCLSSILRQVRLIMGKATLYEAIVPRLWFVIEGNTLKGKIEGLIATRFMTDAQAAMLLDAGEQIERYFASSKD